MNDQGVYYWGHGKRYNDFSSHFRLVFTEKVQKISIDAGFTCPNRDGSKGFGGCTFCNNETFTPSYCSLGKSIESQINDGIQFFSKKYKDMLYVAYFQSYTNTYASTNDLIKLYEEALSHPKVIGLVISTRPDCLSAELLDYFGRKSKEVYLMVELGIESCENKTLELVNRGHTFEDSIDAIHQLASRNIRNCAHMMLGLPGEDRETILQQSTILSGLPIENLKLHQLQIHLNTKMAKQFMEKPDSFQIFETPEEYAELVVDYLELLHPRIIVERFVSQSPGNMLIAPKWGIKNFEFTAIVERRLQQRNTWQGRLCELV